MMPKSTALARKFSPFKCRRHDTARPHLHNYKSTRLNMPSIHINEQPRPILIRRQFIYELATEGERAPPMPRAPG